MVGIAETWLQRLSRSTILVRAAVLTAFLVLILLCCVVVVMLVSGSGGLAGLSVAFAVCWSFAVIALFVGEMFVGESAIMFQMVSGMMIRALGPLSAAIFLSLKIPSLMGAGFLIGLLFFYFASLAFETALLLTNVGPLYKKSA